MSNQIDSIKEKLTDKEYKDLMELTKKMNDEKIEYVRLLHIKAEVSVYYETVSINQERHGYTEEKVDCDQLSISNYDFIHDEETFDSSMENNNLIKKINISKIKYRKTYYNLRLEKTKPGRRSLDLDKGYIEEGYLECLKKDNSGVVGLDNEGGVLIFV